jgi:hypothetical protein
VLGFIFDRKIKRRVFLGRKRYFGFFNFISERFKPNCKFLDPCSVALEDSVI